MYCHNHAHLASRCAAIGCPEQSEKGFHTCRDSTHRKFELIRKERAKAFFQLKLRLQHAGISQPQDSVGGEMVNLVEDDDGLEDPAHKSNEGNQTVKFRLGRRRTHNEQIIVPTCGIISARATMFGAEAISGVKDFLKSAYNFEQMDLPDIIFYDNNCNLQSHLQKERDDFFRYCILPVDVFHFKSKHKQTDEFCQKHCNPVLWQQELLNKDGKTWKFNSSAAEQANVWIGGYKSIVCEMLPYHFDFFLDEMINLRNEFLITRLEMAGKAPYIIPLYHRPE
ncbi:hypothetical protein C8J56DRAFT_1046753 [Mycena floridula]|nr:hypothetical protein C8J56DRAFT_1046753 [Mycena floridula]